MTPLVLRADYQQPSVDAVRREWARWQRPIVSAATGMGKTVIGIGLARELLTQKPDGRLLWLAHRKELITQPYEAFRRWCPELSCGIVKQKRREYDRQVVIASVPSLGPKRLPELPHLDWILIDEAHHCLRDNSYGRIVNYVYDDSPGVRLAGMTATPWRTDGGLGGVFDGCVGGYDLQWGIEHGRLVPVVGKRAVTDISLDGVAKRGGDFVAKSLSERINTDDRNRKVVDEYLNVAGERPFIAFAADIAHAQDLAVAFRARGVACEAIWDGIDKECGKGSRERVLADHKAGRLHGVVNVGILTEGYDDPRIRCVILARPTRSKLLLFQMVGRGTRLAAGTEWAHESADAGKRDCLLLDFADAVGNAGPLVSILDLGVPVPDVETGEEILPPEEPVVDTGPPTDRHGRVEWTLQEFDLFTGRLRWEWVGQTRVLGLDDKLTRIVVVWPDAPGYRAILADVKERRVQWLTWGSVPESEALRKAESCCRKSGANGRQLYKHPSFWAKPAYPQQRTALERYGFPAGETVHWSRAKARRAREWCLARATFECHIHGRWPPPGRLLRYAREFYRAGGQIPEETDVRPAAAGGTW